MAELVVLNFKAAEGKFDALADMFRAVLDDTRAYDGCIKVDVYEDESSSTITLVEEWKHSHTSRNISDGELKRAFKKPLKIS